MSLREPRRAGVKIWQTDRLYSIVDTWQPECADIRIELRRIARHLVRDGLLHTREHQFEYSALQPEPTFSLEVQRVNREHHATHECDDCRGRYLYDDREFARRWKVVQVSAVNYWAKGVKSSARIINRRIASLGVLHFNDRMYCPSSVVEKDIKSLYARAQKIVVQSGRNTVLVDGIAVPILLSRQKTPILTQPPVIDISAGYVIEEPIHQHGWRVVESGITDSIVPMFCECGAVGVYERFKDRLTVLDMKRVEIVSCDGVRPTSSLLQG